jgi:hypothetical protein
MGMDGQDAEHIFFTRIRSVFYCESSVSYILILFFPEDREKPEPGSPSDY